jgi:hypothetical protein
MASIARPANALIGSAGVHHVASELSRRGLVALTTTRNTQGFDVVVASPNGRRHANIEVKTSLKKVGFWPVGRRVLTGSRNFYVFLRYLDGERRFQGFLGPSREVKRQVQRWRSAKWTPSSYLPDEPREQTRLARRWSTWRL